MGLGIVTDDDFLKELENSSNDSLSTEKEINNNPPRISNDNEESEPIVGEVIELKSVGRNSEVNNVPQSLRKIIAEEHAVNGFKSAQHLAESFGGLSQPTLSTYGSGNISRGIESAQSNDLNSYLNGRKGKISKRAINKLNLALNHISDDKLSGLEVRELSCVAKDMAQIVKHMEPTVKESQRDPVQFHFYSPTIKNENHYETVTAKDNY